MPDRSNVIKGLEGMIDCFFNIFRNDTDSYKCAKAQEYSDCAIDAIALLKEQEAVKPVRDVLMGRIWLCGNCGSYVGFEDNDPCDPNEFDKYCRECGRPVLWESR